ncbi:MAG: hypothetical protein WCK90_03670 [archaeon]
MENKQRQSKEQIESLERIADSFEEEFARKAFEGVGLNMQGRCDSKVPQNRVGKAMVCYNPKTGFHLRLCPIAYDYTRAEEYDKLYSDDYFSGLRKSIDNEFRGEGRDEWSNLKLRERYFGYHVHSLERSVKDPADFTDAAIRLVGEKVKDERYGVVSDEINNAPKENRENELVVVGGLNYFTKNGKFYSFGESERFASVECEEYLLPLCLKDSGFEYGRMFYQRSIMSEKLRRCNNLVKRVLEVEK